MLDHEAAPSKELGAKLMMDLLGSSATKAAEEVKKTKGAHCRFVYLRELIDAYIKVTKQAEKDNDAATLEKYKDYIVRAYLLLLVGTTIFSNKAKNYVDLKYL
ncbi:serine/threonine-protein phosphatase 7 long form-like protein, partial [Trifolium medium]|nr:serine/threonine-protein phosphatase 7 long form-like protein [Trifolium medium]